MWFLAQTKKMEQRKKNRLWRKKIKDKINKMFREQSKELKTKWRFCDRNRTLGNERILIKYCENNDPR